MDPAFLGPLSIKLFGGSYMNFLIPYFVPVPSGETMRLISIISLIVGICVTVMGVIFLFLNKRKGNEKNTLPWILICVGALLMANHGIQLIFRS